MTAILVTGASGTVGSNVVRRLCDSGETVRAFVRNARNAATVLGSDVDLVVGDRMLEVPGPRRGPRSAGAR